MTIKNYFEMMGFGLMVGGVIFVVFAGIVLLRARRKRIVTAKRKWKLLLDAGFGSVYVIPTIVCGTHARGGWCYLLWISHRLGVSWTK